MKNKTKAVVVRMPYKLWRELHILKADEKITSLTAAAIEALTALVECLKEEGS